MIYLLCLFTAAIIVLEIATGCAIIGWAGDKQVAVREKSPGPFWFAIVLQALAGIGVPLLVIFGS